MCPSAGENVMFLGTLGSLNGPGEQFLCPFGGFENPPKGILRRTYRQSRVYRRQKCILGAGKVVSGRSGEYLGFVGSLLRHMVKVGTFEILGGFDPPGEPLGSLNGSGELFCCALWRF